LAHKKTVVGAGKIAEYRETLAFLCALEHRPQQKKALTFGAINSRIYEHSTLTQLANTLRSGRALKERLLPAASTTSCSK
jgi:hypothetical protein